jgi:hypothetical protein
MKKIILMAGLIALTSGVALAQGAKEKEACTKDKEGAACCSKDNKKSAKAEGAAKMSCCDKEHGTASNMHTGHTDLNRDQNDETNSSSTSRPQVQISKGKASKM